MRDPLGPQMEREYNLHLGQGQPDGTKQPWMQEASLDDLKVPPCLRLHELYSINPTQNRALRFHPFPFLFAFPLPSPATPLPSHPRSYDDSPG